MGRNTNDFNAGQAQGPNQMVSGEFAEPYGGEFQMEVAPGASSKEAGKKLAKVASTTAPLKNVKWNKSK